MNKVKILFWKVIGIIWDIKPRLHLPKYRDFPIMSTEIAEDYKYPEGIKILFTWDENGRHWCVFSR